MSDAQELVEAALAASTADGCIAIVADHSETNLRWAANSLTTNGQMQSRSMTVVTTFDRSDGTRAGVVTRAVTAVEQVEEMVRSAEALGRDATPADDASPLVEPYEHTDDWSADAAKTSVRVFDQFAPALGAAFDRWRGDDRLLFGFAEHEITSYFLGTSTGLRRRFDQPQGRLEVNGKAADLSSSAWSGVHSRDFTDIDVTAVTDALEQRLGWGGTRLELPPGRYETILPPSAVADLMIYAYWTASARDADEGRNVYSSGSGGTRIGEQLSPLPLTLRSDPSAPGLECEPFQVVTSSYGGLESVFDNGLPVTATNWIDKGRLADLIRTRAWAAKSGDAPRGFTSNLILEADPDGSGPSLAEMIERLLQAHRDAGDPGAGLQHVHRQQGVVTT
jgi:predicted Zn-dependent protease